MPCPGTERAAAPGQIAQRDVEPVPRRMAWGRSAPGAPAGPARTRSASSTGADRSAPRPTTIGPDRTGRRSMAPGNGVIGSSARARQTSRSMDCATRDEGQRQVQVALAQAARTRMRSVPALRKGPGACAWPGRGQQDTKTSACAARAGVRCRRARRHSRHQARSPIHQARVKLDQAGHRAAASRPHRRAQETPRRMIGQRPLKIRASVPRPGSRRRNRRPPARTSRQPAAKSAEGPQPPLARTVSCGRDNRIEPVRDQRIGGCGVNPDRSSPGRS